MILGKISRVGYIFSTTKRKKTESAMIDDRLGDLGLSLRHVDIAVDSDSV